MKPSRSMVDKAAGDDGQPAEVADLTAQQRDWLRLRFAHLCEAQTGFRSGDSLRALAGEPKAAYDPARTLLRDRLRAKASELKALAPDEAAMLGLGRVSFRTLERWAARCRRLGVLGCADGRWLRGGGGHAAVADEVSEALFAVHAETLHRSRLSMRSKERLIHQYLRERHGPQMVVPSYWTLRRVWHEWFGAGGARQRYQRSAAAAPATGAHVVVHRPGQVVALDTTVLPVKVRESVFGEPVSTHLTLAMDVFTRSLVAFRLTLVSDTSVDVAMLLRDVMMPARLREGWGEDMRWPYPGVPASVLAELAGYKAAALPFFTPETVTTDHGAVYKNHHLVEVHRVTGVNILPARALRPTDKHTVERAFGAAQSLLFELLPGYQGVDVADRGADVEGDAVLTMAAMEHLIATWIVRVWQNRRLEHAPSWDPGGTHSPNSLFAAAIGQGGFSLQIPPEDLYYGLLPATHVKIHGRRGVKVRGLWYDGPGLDPYRDEVSTRGGRHKGKWVIRFDKRDPRQVFFQDPADTHIWHRLGWVGMPPDGQMPAFGDKRREDLLRTVANAGLKPKSDTELLPVLLDLVGSHVPVDQWPTQMSKQERRQHAREVTQAAASAQDRPGWRPDRPPAAVTNNVVPLQFTARARQASGSVDAQRRRRREQAVPDVPPPPQRLGEGLRRQSRLLIPNEDEQ